MPRLSKRQVSRRASVLTGSRLYSSDRLLQFMKVAKLLAWVYDSVHRRLIEFSQDRLCYSAFSYHDQALHNTFILIQDLRDRIQPLLGSRILESTHT